MTNKRTAFTYAEGDMVRLENRPARVKVIHLNGTVTCWTDYGLRTVNSLSLTPAKNGDELIPLPNEWRARRKAGTR